MVLLVAVVGAGRGGNPLLFCVDLVAAGRADQLRCANFMNDLGGGLGRRSGPRELVGFEDVRFRLASSWIGGALMISHICLLKRITDSAGRNLRGSQNRAVMVLCQDR